jgi:hypothetical protein
LPLSSSDGGVKSSRVTTQASGLPVIAAENTQPREASSAR